MGIRRYNRGVEIDLTQLPMPDWGLHCPQCRYPLRGLPSHRCPECGTEFDIEELVSTRTRLRPPRFTGEELPLPDFGLSCAACGEPLAGATARACPQCGEPFDPESLRPPRKWFILDAELCGSLPIPGVQALLAADMVPYAPMQEKSVREIFGGHGITFSRLRVPSEFYFEVLWLLQRARREMEQARAAAGADDWTCSSCGEENPGHFEVCWNCEAVKS